MKTRLLDQCFRNNDKPNKFNQFCFHIQNPLVLKLKLKEKRNEFQFYIAYEYVVHVLILCCKKTMKGLTI